MRFDCPVCHSATSTPLVRRSGVSVLQNAPRLTRQEAIATPRADLDMRLCDRCGFVWNALFDQSLIRYSVDYENCQTQSDLFSAHLDERIDRVALSFASARRTVVVEIGCGQGDFLDRLAQRVGGDRMTAFGFDPSWRGSDSEGPNGSRLYRRLFDRTAIDALDIDPDIVIARHTIEHIPDPRDFLRTIRAALPAGSTARLFIETPCSQWIRAHAAMHDFFYEHCSLFDTGSLGRVLAGSGFAPTRIELVFGGQYLWAEATSDEPDERAVESDDAFRQKWRETITAARSAGAVAVWGGGAKGATFLLLVDPDRALVDCVVDINPRKQGRFIPATGHEVVGPTEAAARGVATVVIMNPNYTAEIMAAIQARAWAPRIYALD